MSSNYKKRFSDKGLRLQSWDYGWNGKYFVTIKTKNRISYFGDVISEAMHYSPEGKLANEYWEIIPEQFPFAKLDEFIVMPNHVHGIIEIDKSNELVDTADSGEASPLVQQLIIVFLMLQRLVALQAKKIQCYMIISPELLDGTKAE